MKLPQAFVSSFFFQSLQSTRTANNHSETQGCTSAAQHERLRGENYCQKGAVSSFADVISRKPCVASDGCCRTDTDHKAAVLLTGLIRYVSFPLSSRRVCMVACVCAVEEPLNCMPSFNETPIPPNWRFPKVKPVGLPLQLLYYNKNLLSFSDEIAALFLYI